MSRWPCSIFYVIIVSPHNLLVMVIQDTDVFLYSWFPVSSNSFWTVGSDETGKYRWNYCYFHGHEEGTTIVCDKTSVFCLNSFILSAFIWGLCWREITLHRCQKLTHFIKAKEKLNRAYYEFSLHILIQRHWLATKSTANMQSKEY